MGALKVVTGISNPRDSLRTVLLKTLNYRDLDLHHSLTSPPGASACILIPYYSEFLNTTLPYASCDVGTHGRESLHVQKRSVKYKR